MKAGRSVQRLKVVAIFGVVAAFVLPASVASARVTVPPGSTEGDQYTEEVPNGGGSGSVDTGSGGTGGGTGGSQGVAPATQALNALGPEGQTAADLANSNRPPKDVKQGQEQGQQPKPEPSSSTAGEGGMGLLFVLLLVVTALAAIAYGVRRRLTPA